MLARAWLSASTCSCAALRNPARLRSANWMWRPMPRSGTVDLQHEAGRGDRLVLVAHGLGDGEEVGLVIRVVVVAEEQRDDAGRGGAHEVGAPSPSGGLEVLDVALGRLRIAHGDGRVAGRRLPPRAARIAEDARGQLREVRQIGVRERVALSAEAAQPVLHVGGVARLAHLAVVDEIDAGLDLLTHHLGHRGPECGVERGGVDRHALFLGVHRADRDRPGAADSRCAS